MSSITKSRTNIFAALGSLFSSGEDIIEYNEDDLTPDLRKVVNSIDTRDVEACVVNNSSKKGGFGTKINPIKDSNIEKAMRAKHKEVKQNSVEDRERE